MFRGVSHIFACQLCNRAKFAGMPGPNVLVVGRRANHRAVHNHELSYTASGDGGARIWGHWVGVAGVDRFLFCCCWSGVGMILAGLGSV